MPFTFIPKINEKSRQLYDKWAAKFIISPSEDSICIRIINLDTKNEIDDKSVNENIFKKSPTNKITSNTIIINSY